jgi:phage repressor protein C with HTH and peptisase S24 domain
MSTLWGRNIEHLLVVSGKKAVDLARFVQVSGATVSDWISGKSKSIDGYNLLRVAHFFKVSPEEILEQDLTGLARCGEAAAAYTITMRHVPVVGNASLSDDGAWTEAGNAAVDGFVPYPSNDPNAFGLRVDSDGLRPRYKPGEVLIIEPLGAIEPGHEVAVKTREGRVLVRVLDWRRTGMVQLSSVNEDHKPITLREEHLLFIYRVIGSVPADLHQH